MGCLLFLIKAEYLRFLTFRQGILKMGLVKDAMSSRKGKHAYHWTRFFISFFCGLFGMLDIQKKLGVMMPEMAEKIAEMPDMASVIWLGLAVVIFFVVYLTVASWIAKILVVIEYLASGR